jgi:hypothetical protein
MTRNNADTPAQKTPTERPWTMKKWNPSVVSLIVAGVTGLAVGRLVTPHFASPWSNMLWSPGATVKAEGMMVPSTNGSFLFLLYPEGRPQSVLKIHYDFRATRAADPRMPEGSVSLRATVQSPPDPPPPKTPDNP